MAILLDNTTPVIVQGITSREGSFHAQQMQLTGTRLVGGVSPGKGGTTHVDVPVFDTVAQAVCETGATASGIFVPAPFAADAIMEAAAAGISLIVCITEGIPIQDMIRVKDYLRGYPGTRLVGANCPGLLTPGQAKIGIIPQRFSSPGPVGIVSRSGTLTYETMAALTAAGMGQSTVVGIGGDPVLGVTFADVIALFEDDPATTHLAVIGEIGGSDEERAAELLGRGSPPPWRWPSWPPPGSPALARSPSASGPGRTAAPAADPRAPALPARPLDWRRAGGARRRGQGGHPGARPEPGAAGRTARLDALHPGLLDAPLGPRHAAAVPLPHADGSPVPVLRRHPVLRLHVAGRRRPRRLPVPAGAAAVRRHAGRRARRRGRGA